MNLVNFTEGIVGKRKICDRHIEGSLKGIGTTAERVFAVEPLSLEK